MKKKKPTAIQKRAAQPKALSRFDYRRLRRQLPLRLTPDPATPPSPKRRYRSAYRYLGHKALRSAVTWETGSAFTLTCHLIDFGPLEPLLAHSVYRPSAKGQTPFHPVSMFLLALFRRLEGLSRIEALKQVRNPERATLRGLLGFASEEIPTESGLRDFEARLAPALMQEIQALQIDMLQQAGLLPPVERHWLSFDGMLHQARCRMRCAHVQDVCLEPAPRPCRAREKGKQGCSCDTDACKSHCHFVPTRDPDARLIVYTGSNKRRHLSPNTPREGEAGSRGRARLVYGYYSYSGQLLDPELSTYWMLPAAMGPATEGDRSLFPQNFSYLRQRFPWLQLEAVIADAGAGYQNCLDLIWEAGALRLVDITASASDRDPQRRLQRGYDERGYPLCPFGYVTRPNGHDYQRRLSKWRCAKTCLLKPADERPPCDYQRPLYKHGYTVTVGRSHQDGSVRLAREIPYGSQRWKELFHRRNCAESRNGVLQGMGLKRLPVHGLTAGHTVILLADFGANQRTLLRLMREASRLELTG